MNFIAFRVIASYSKFRSCHTLEYDLNLAIFITKRGQICEKKRHRSNWVFSLLIVISQNLL